MNILIHIPNISKGSGGVFQYTTNLLNILKNDACNHYWIFTQNDEIINQVQDARNMGIVKFNFKKLAHPQPILIRGINFLKRKYPKIRKIFPSYLDRIIRKYKINIVHSPYQDYVDTIGVPFITTMHDVQELHFPQFFNSEARAARAVHYKNAIELSDKVIVSYQHIKNDLIRFFNVNPENVVVILLDLHQSWHEGFNEKDVLTNTSLKVPDKFLLLPAATWIHKNHLLLLKTIKELKDEGININLVCTGDKTEYYFNVLEEYIAENKLSNIVDFKGIVTNQELYSLYKNCIGVVIPTLYEAGSFPLYEAILLNVPVICSNTTSLPETIKNEEYIFDTNSVSELKLKIQKLYFEEEFRNECKKHLLTVAKNLKTNTALKKIIDCYMSTRQKNL